jgi:RNA polymerase sigma-54 factor
MQKVRLRSELRLKHVLEQKLSPQQLQTIKLLQIPSVAMRARIEEELASNPALDEGGDTEEDQEMYDELTHAEESMLQDYTGSDSYHAYGSGNARMSQDWQAITNAKLATASSLEEQLLEQLSFLRLGERQHKIGTYIIGSIESEGYLRRDLEAIVNDLAFTHYIDTNVQEVANILKQDTAL